MEELADALLYCHAKKVIHRDIKPDNIFFSTSEFDSPLLLGDFGLSKLLTEGVTVTRVGTPGYQSPQIIQGHLYTFKTDIWSIGIIAFFLLQGKCPFDAEKSNEGQLLEKMRNNDYKFKIEVSKMAEDFIAKCLQFDESKRPSANELLEHPWIKMYS